MNKLSKNYFNAIGTIIGTTIGAGIFVLPLISYKSGWLIMLFYFVFLGWIQYYVQKIYAEIILSTKDHHQLPGYVEKYYGKKRKNGALALVLVSSNLSMLVYIIMGGKFLHLLVSPYIGGSLVMYNILFLVVSALLTFWGPKLVSQLESFFSILMFLTILLIIFKGWDVFSLHNFIAADWSNTLLPYGPVFFALGATNIIPMVCRLVEDKKECTKSVIFWGTFISTAITFIFAFMIAGITGIETTDDSLAGLFKVLGDGVLQIAAIFGVLAIITSYFAMIQATHDLYIFDLKMGKKLAWSIAIFGPYLLYLIGLNSATIVISLAGAISGGLMGLIYIFLLPKVKKKRDRKPEIENYSNKYLSYLLMLCFVLGLIYELSAIF